MNVETAIWINNQSDDFEWDEYGGRPDIPAGLQNQLNALETMDNNSDHDWGEYGGCPYISSYVRNKWEEEKEKER